MPEQFITEEEMNDIKGLMHYLNEAKSLLSVEAKLIDCNGDVHGVIKYGENGNYSFYFDAKE